jgi:Collagen triple helix repeat (20 copies)
VNSTYTIAPNTFLYSKSIEWQVQTWGVDANPSPFTASAVFVTMDPIPRKYPVLLDLTSGRLEASSTGTGGGGGATATPVTMRRTSSTAQAITDSNVTTLFFETPQDDVGGITYTNSGVNNGNWTIPADGTYLMSMQYQLNAAAPVTTNVRRTATIQLNGTTIAQNDAHASASAIAGPVITTTRRLSAGDTVRFAGYQTSNTTINTGTNPAVNWASITKVDGIQGLQGIQGPTGNTGSQGPPGTTGATGSQGPQGVQGPTGLTGAAGTPGEKWFSQSGAPAGATGIVGDWSLDIATGDVYEKTGASAWTLRGNIRGPQGATGATGATGPAGPAGSGAGDVIGPAGAVNNDIAVYDATTGKLLKDGGATIAQVRDRSTHTGTQLKATISDLGTIGTAAAKNVPSSGDATGTDVVQANDTRLTNARTPTAHATSHGLSQSDPVALDASQIGSGTLGVSRVGASAAATTYLKGAASGTATWVVPSTLKTDLALVKGDVGLGNVQNVDQTNASNLTSGTIAAARLPAETNGTYHSFASTAATNMLTTTFTTIAGWSSETSTGSFISGVVSGAFTFSAGGVFEIIGTGCITSGGANPQRRIIALYKGATELIRHDVGAGSTGANPVTLQAVYVARFAVGESFTIQLWQNSGSTIPMGSAPGHECQIIKLSD